MMIPLKISAWNAHALMDKAGSDRPQRRGGGGGGGFRWKRHWWNKSHFAKVGEIKKKKNVGAGDIFF